MLGNRAGGTALRVGERHLRSVVGGAAIDPWGGVDSTDEYDVDGFYVRSVNKHDHTAQTRVPMHPEVYAEITRLIASGDLAGTPINSYQAFMRDAAVHNMHRLARILKDGRLEEFAAMQRRLAEADALASGAEMLRKLVSEADERLNHATKSGDRVHVEQMLELYEPMCEVIREPYGSELEEVLRDARSWLRAKR